MKIFLRFNLRVCALLLSGIIINSCAEKTKEAPPPPQISVVKVVQKDVPIYKEFVGQVYGYSDIPIRARVSGFLEGIHFNEGLRVKKGQLLYTIDPEPFAAKVATQQSLLAEAKTSLAKSKSDLDRIEPLAKINAVSQSDLDAAKANYEASLAYVDAMKSNLRFAKINLGYCRIMSPIDGVIGKTEARVGEFVGQNPNPVILNTVSTIDSIRVEFFLTEADYIRIARAFDSNKKSEVSNEKRELSLVLADGSTFKYKGFVNFINRQVDPHTGSLLIQTTFPNPEELLRPGQYAKVIVQMKEVKNGLLIPQRCVMELQGQNSVYVVDSNNIIQNKQITTGERINDMVLVTKGLEKDEKVVIDALQKVTSGLTVKPEVIVFESKPNQKN